MIQRTFSMLSALLLLSTIYSPALLSSGYEGANSETAVEQPDTVEVDAESSDAVAAVDEGSIGDEDSTTRLSADQVTIEYANARSARDWSRMGELMHPDALSSLRSTLDPLLTREENESFRQMYLGIKTIEEADSLSDEAIFTRFARHALGSDPSGNNAMTVRELEVIGTLESSDDTVYVIYKVLMPKEKYPFPQIGVMALKRHGETWRGLLRGEMAGIAAGLAGALDDR